MGFPSAIGNLLSCAANMVINKLASGYGDIPVAALGIVKKIEMLPVFVIKKDKRREPFDAAKVRNGIIRACEKRPVPLEEIERLVRQVETRVCQQMDEEVTTEQIGLLVMEGLKQLDEVAYIRFASVYRQFKDVQSFMEELQQLLDSQKKPEE